MDQKIPKVSKTTRSLPTGDIETEAKIKALGIQVVDHDVTILPSGWTTIKDMSVGGAIMVYNEKQEEVARWTEDIEGQGFNSQFMVYPVPIPPFQKKRNAVAKRKTPTGVKEAKLVVKKPKLGKRQKPAKDDAKATEDQKTENSKTNPNELVVIVLKQTRDGSFLGEDYTTTDCKRFQFTTQEKAAAALFAFFEENTFLYREYDFKAHVGGSSCEQCRAGEHLVRVIKPDSVREFSLEDCVEMVRAGAETYISPKLTLAFSRTVVDKKLVL
jgi:hypothetical protein